MEQIKKCYRIAGTGNIKKAISFVSEVFYAYSEEDAILQFQVRYPSFLITQLIYL